MASFLDKIQIKTPTSPKHKLDLSCQHVTTFDFMTLQPIYYRNLIPQENLDLRGVAMVRMDDLPVPTYGRCDLNVRAFFVPFRTIFAGWNDFIADVIHTPAGGSSNGVPQPIVPSLFNSTLVALFQLSSYSRQASADETPDFVTTEQGAENGFIFTPFGRQVYKILLSLGYRIRWTEDESGISDERLSALPILAFLRVYLDYYYPSQYYDRPDRVQLEEYLKYDAPTGPIVLVVNHLDFIFTHVFKVCYDSDYFTSAFDNPAGPNVSNTTNPFTFVDITTDGTSQSVVTSDDSQSGNTNGTPVIKSSRSTSPANLSQYAIDMLKKLSDYMKRNQLVGNRAVDRLLARFGVKVSDNSRSILLGSHKVPLFVQDVMNTADTAQYNASGDLVSGARTGEYAGKGIMAGEFNFSVDAGSDFGMFIVMTSLVPKTGYYQGIDRHNLHLTRTDFLLPEFDAIGTQPIYCAELLIPNDGRYVVNEDLYTTPFGFAPRMAEYKIARDFVTGDFQVPSKSRAGMSSDSWHLFRDMNQPQFVSTISNLIHQASFVYGDDADQFNRIFANTSDSADHFTAHYSFNITSFQPAKPLYDQYEFDGDGQDILVDVNGTKVN